MIYIGWFSIVLAFLALAPSLVPGALSLLAFYLSLVSLIISITTIKSFGIIYFKATSIIVGFGMLIINDYLRIYGSLPQSTWVEKMSLYGIYLIICSIGLLSVKRHGEVSNLKA
ncbi:hypothetical protein KO527_13745 [Pseudoalteromonas sp. C2R02]|uniref:hypothetical protein n=1 Tax=Pseudoalteromonas sp. C2R02 TaxID=2841565 RepID=UPI001C089088|nr:hypothetical protein [Pseudoalteromonas sp. C2R02]MBU2970413.1 hypothetical protein [Pseudoalteromonas sp. C2R02]